MVMESSAIFNLGQCPRQREQPMIYDPSTGMVTLATDAIIDEILGEDDDYEFSIPEGTTTQEERPTESERT